MEKDFPAIREEAERLRQKFNDGLQDSEIFYSERFQWDHFFSLSFVTGEESYGEGELYLHYLLVIVILLLVPAINLSSMTLSRMRKRMSEIGVRKAFGATANVLLRQVFYENLLLTLIAGAVGMLFSYACTFLLNDFLFSNSENRAQMGNQLLRQICCSVPWIFLAAFIFCLLLNLLSACIPAWRASRMNITDALNQRSIMNRNLLKQIWNERRSNAFLWMELFVVFVILWYIVDVVYVTLSV